MGQENLVKCARMVLKVMKLMMMKMITMMMIMMMIQWLNALFWYNIT